MVRAVFAVEVSTHSRPKAAGPANGIFYPLFNVSTHSRPKAAGTFIKNILIPIKFQHTAARRRLVRIDGVENDAHKFQHTAARRRLVLFICNLIGLRSFNTQPPEGGWYG